ncbi:cornifelin homolog B-like [Ciona intestinalis]
MSYPPPNYSPYPLPPMTSQPQVIYQPQATAPAPVIVTQPTPQNTFIVNNNNNATKPDQTGPNLPGNRFKLPANMWSSSLVDCFLDIPSCCLGLFCTRCLACWVASRYNETCCLGWCGGPTLVALRTKIRADHDIQGSICHDCTCMVCCEPLVLCQMHRELNRQGYM